MLVFNKDTSIFHLMKNVGYLSKRKRFKKTKKKHCLATSFKCPLNQQQYWILSDVFLTYEKIFFQGSLLTSCIIHTNWTIKSSCTSEDSLAVVDY